MRNLIHPEPGKSCSGSSASCSSTRLADGGTIFLDEIGKIPLELQAKLLRVIQEGEFGRLGSPRTVKVDVRVITASNRNLTGRGMSGSWRVSSNER